AAPAKKAAAPAKKAAAPAKKAAKASAPAQTTLNPQAAWPFPTGSKP
ncbi:MAG: histone, partial [Pseudomonadota bacterium]